MGAGGVAAFVGEVGGGWTDEGAETLEVVVDTPTCG